jgi:hypothetical protein
MTATWSKEKYIVNDEGDLIVECMVISDRETVGTISYEPHVEARPAGDGKA